MHLNKKGDRVKDTIWLGGNKYNILLIEGISVLKSRFLYRSNASLSLKTSFLDVVQSIRLEIRFQGEWVKHSVIVFSGAKFYIHL